MARHVKQRAEARGTPPVTQPHAYIWDKIFDGRVWEVAPEDHGLKPRRFYLDVRQRATRAGMKVMVHKRGHLVYVQNLDEKQDSLDIRALNGRPPDLRRWLLGSETTDEQPPEPGEEDETEIEPESPFIKPIRNRDSKTFVPARMLEPYVLTCMNQFFDYSLLNSEVMRIVDKLVSEAGTETRLLHHQQVRQCLLTLVDDERSLIGHVPIGTFVYSPTEPVPLWSPEVHAQIMRNYPAPRDGTKSQGRLLPTLDLDDESTPHMPPRIVMPERLIVEQPRYKVFTAEKEGTPVSTPTINGSDLAERVSGLTRDLSQLVVEIESMRLSPNERARYVAEIDGLNAINARLEQERNSAVNQLKAIAQAQATMAQLLSGQGLTG